MEVHEGSDSVLLQAGILKITAKKKELTLLEGQKAEQKEIKRTLPKSDSISGRRFQLDRCQGHDG